MTGSHSKGHYFIKVVMLSEELQELPLSQWHRNAVFTISLSLDLVFCLEDLLTGSDLATDLKNRGCHCSGVKNVSSDTRNRMKIFLFCLWIVLVETEFIKNRVVS